VGSLLTLAAMLAGGWLTLRVLYGNPGSGSAGS
jgi:hypothetical protein